MDLVEQMLRLAGQGPDGVARFMSSRHVPRGHAIEARVYAEDPGRDGAPSPGLVTSVTFPDGPVRVDAWIEAGQEVSPHYDPMLAKVIAHGADRDAALDALAAALARHPRRRRYHQPRLAAGRRPAARRAGRHARDVDPRRRGRPGAADRRARAGRADDGAGLAGTAGLLAGRRAAERADGRGRRCARPTSPSATPRAPRPWRSPPPGRPCGSPHDALVCLGGAVSDAVLVGRGSTGRGRTVPPSRGGRRSPCQRAASLRVGAIPGPGLRAYLAVRGGLDVPRYLGSASTFTLGRFGGHGGRALQAGDVLRPGAAGPLGEPAEHARGAAPGDRPRLGDRGHRGTARGAGVLHPGGHRRAVRQRLHRPPQLGAHRRAAHRAAPAWAREDGGEAGLHPSNIHDVPYAVGALDFTGDTPIILGPDGPSLGGFVCPAVVASGELWKTGQLRPGDTVRFVPVREADGGRAARPPRGARRCRAPGATATTASSRAASRARARPPSSTGETATTTSSSSTATRSSTWACGCGSTPCRRPCEAEGLDGVVDLTPGIRSLQVHTDAGRLRARSLVPLLRRIEEELPPTHELRVPSRSVRLPLSWDDPATRLAIERYMSGVRSDAPWTPVEHRVHPPDQRPCDGRGRPRHRLRREVPGPRARRRVPRRAGRHAGRPPAPAGHHEVQPGADLDGGELRRHRRRVPVHLRHGGPGGYQFVGRTIQVWNRFRQGRAVRRAALGLRFFDQIEWYPVSAEELLDLRAETDAGRGHVAVTDGWFDYGSYTRFLAEQRGGASRRSGPGRRPRSRRRRNAGGPPASSTGPTAGPAVHRRRRPGRAVPARAHTACRRRSPPASGRWRCGRAPGSPRATSCISLEAMKMETVLTAPHDGTVAGVYVAAAPR